MLTARTTMVNINSLSFDLTGCSPQSNGPNEKSWMSEDGVAHLLRFDQGPVSWPFDLTDVEAARQFYGDQCASAGGVMLHMDVVNLDQVEVLRGIFKYRAPISQSLAMYFVGIFWVPFSNFRYQLNIEAIERGTTGMREAVVSAMDSSSYPDPSVLRRCPWPKPEADAEPIHVSSAEEMFEHMRKAPLHELPSDDEQFDALFVDHPLSLVRARMKGISDTLRMNKMWWQSIKPFRLRC